MLISDLISKESVTRNKANAELLSAVKIYPDEWLFSLVEEINVIAKERRIIKEPAEKIGIREITDRWIDWEKKGRKK